MVESLKDGNNFAFNCSAKYVCVNSPQVPTRACLNSFVNRVKGYLKFRVSVVDDFFGACNTRSTREPTGDTTVTEILATEGF